MKFPPHLYSKVFLAKIAVSEIFTILEVSIGHVGIKIAKQSRKLNL